MLEDSSDLVQHANVEDADAAVKKQNVDDEKFEWWDSLSK